MIDYPLSPISFNGFSILSFSLDFGGFSSAKEEEGVRNASLEFSVSANHEQLDEGAYRCACVLSLSCTVDEVDVSDATASNLGVVRAKVSGTAAGKFAPEMTVESIHDTLEANAVSFLYGKVRTYIELLTASCPMGTLSLPAIMPVSNNDNDAN